MAFTGAATVVVAQTFQLIDPNGVIVANLTNAVVLGSNATVLDMLHNNPLFKDSELVWSQDQGTGDFVYLHGPEPLAGTNPPSVTLQVLPTQEIASINSGTFPTRQPAFINLVSSSGAPQTQITVGADSTVLVDGALNSRGDLYGTTFQEAVLSPNTNLTIAGVTLLTINLPNAPVGGSWALVTFSGRITNAINSANFAELQLWVDGTRQVGGWFQSNWPVIGASTVASFSKLFTFGTGTHTISVIGACGIVDNSAIAGGTAAIFQGCTLQVIYNR